MFVDVITEEAAAGASAAYYAEQRETWGFLPNYALAFGTRPDVAAAWNALNCAIRTGMDRRRFELFTIAAARALRSTYCTVAHSKFFAGRVCGRGHLATGSPRPGRRFARASRPRGLSIRGKVAGDAASVEQVDVDRLRAVGLSDADIAEVVYAVAARCFFTRVLDGLGSRLDPQTAQTFSQDLLASMVVGRPVAES